MYLCKKNSLLPFFNKFAWQVILPFGQEKPMTLYDFSLMCENRQTSRLYKDGVYIGKRNDGNEVVVLYQLDGFYVEIFYRKYRRIISHLKFFTSTEKLTPYLQHLDIEELIKCVS